MNWCISASTINSRLKWTPSQPLLHFRPHHHPDFLSFCQPLLHVINDTRLRWLGHGGRNGKHGERVRERLTHYSGWKVSSHDTPACLYQTPVVLKNHHSVSLLSWRTQNHMTAPCYLLSPLAALHNVIIDTYKDFIISLAGWCIYQQLSFTLQPSYSGASLEERSDNNSHFVPCWPCPHGDWTRCLLITAGL